MKCPRCGAEVRSGAPFCPKCGLTIQNPPITNTNYNNNSGYPQNNGSNQNKTTIAIIIAAGAIIFVIVALLTYMMISETGPFKPDPTPTPAPTATPVPSPEPTVQVVYVTEQVAVPVKQEPQATPVTSGAIANPSYSRYSSSEYGFSIAYPSHFSVYNDGGFITLYTVQSADGSARELIAAEVVDGETVSSEMNSYLASHPGSVTYQTSGSDYYAVNVRNGSMEYYKYCKFKHGNMYWFEFIYPTAQHDIYDVYINDIYSSLSIY